ncbi:hypothetical protein SAMN05428952_10147 [Nitrosomonas sp. Nm132]|nr:hypothetical protein SAMN05428952_10147 [Nitrosomonas sp. Nm132]
MLLSCMSGKVLTHQRPPATSSRNDPFINVRALLTYQLN